METLTKDNIGKFDYCFGCTACAGVCPVDIIKIQEINGFLKPVISSNDRCIECQICLKTCSFNNADLVQNKTPFKIYSGHSTNEDVVQTCTSGGVVFEILKMGLNCGYKVIAVRYNYTTNRPEHYLVTDINELNQSKGSKYIQSDLSVLIKGLSPKFKYIMIGTPCQIASVRNYIKLRKIEKNFLLIDFFCHGVPSTKMWDLYRKDIEKRTGNTKKVVFRPKDYGWHNSLRVKIEGDSGYNLAKKDNHDAFFDFFLGNRCLLKACYDSCLYKQCNTSADIRVGDLWGHKYLDNDTGVSGIVTFTEIGQKFLSECSDLNLYEEDYSTVFGAQMTHNANRSPSYQICSSLLAHDLSFNLIKSICSFVDTCCNLPKRIHSKIKCQ